jgi:hypothetical protein
MLGHNLTEKMLAGEFTGAVPRIKHKTALKLFSTSKLNLKLRKC